MRWYIQIARMFEIENVWTFKHPSKQTKRNNNDFTNKHASIALMHCIMEEKCFKKRAKSRRRQRRWAWNRNNNNNKWTNEEKKYINCGSYQTTSSAFLLSLWLLVALWPALPGIESILVVVLLEFLYNIVWCMLLVVWCFCLCFFFTLFCCCCRCLFGFDQLHYFLCKLKQNEKKNTSSG